MFLLIPGALYNTQNDSSWGCRICTEKSCMDQGARMKRDTGGWGRRNNFDVLVLPHSSTLTSTAVLQIPQPQECHFWGVWRSFSNSKKSAIFAQMVDPNPYFFFLTIFLHRVKSLSAICDQMCLVEHTMWRQIICHDGLILFFPTLILVVTWINRQHWEIQFCTTAVYIISLNVWNCFWRASQLLI